MLYLSLLYRIFAGPRISVRKSIVLPIVNCNRFRWAKAKPLDRLCNAPCRVDFSPPTTPPHPPGTPFERNRNDGFAHWYSVHESRNGQLTVFIPLLPAIPGQYVWGVRFARTPRAEVFRSIVFLSRIDGKQIPNADAGANENTRLYAYVYRNKTETFLRSIGRGRTMTKNARGQGANGHTRQWRNISPAIEASYSRTITEYGQTVGTVLDPRTMTRWAPSKPCKLNWKRYCSFVFLGARHRNSRAVSGIVNSKIPKLRRPQQ